MKSLYMASLILVSGATSINVAADGIEEMEGFWEGVIDYQDEPLEVRLFVDNGEVKVDYPQLVFANQEVGVEENEEGRVVLSLPMMGAFPVTIEGGRLVGERELSSGAVIRLDLAPGRPFVPGTEEIFFGDDGRVGGTLTLPPGEGPFPVAILLAGASSPNRENVSYRSWDDHLSRRGIAVLAYDRRPDDEYAPHGFLWSLDKHADDVVSAIDLLVGHEKIDREEIYLIAKSRGGWIAFSSAARDPRVSAIVGIGVSAVSMWEQDLQSIEARMRNADESEEAIAAALAYTHLYFATAEDPALWSALERAAAEAAAADWADYVRIPEKPQDLEWFRANDSTDPARMIASLEIPLFLAWGAEDRTVPSLPNQPLFRWLLAPDQLGGSILRVYEGAGHTMEGPLNTDDDPQTVWAGMNPAFMKDVTEWLVSLEN